MIFTYRINQINQSYSSCSECIVCIDWVTWQALCKLPPDPRLSSGWRKSKVVCWLSPTLSACALQFCSIQMSFCWPEWPLIYYLCVDTNGTTMDVEIVWIAGQSSFSMCSRRNSGHWWTNFVTKYFLKLKKINVSISLILLIILLTLLDPYMREKDWFQSEWKRFCVRHSVWYQTTGRLRIYPQVII